MFYLRLVVNNFVIFLLGVPWTQCLIISLCLGKKVAIFSRSFNFFKYEIKLSKISLIVLKHSLIVNDASSHHKKINATRGEGMLADTWWW